MLVAKLERDLQQLIVRSDPYSVKDEQQLLTILT